MNDVIKKDIQLKVTAYFNNSITISDEWFCIIRDTIQEFKGTAVELYITSRYQRKKTPRETSREIYISRRTGYNYNDKFITAIALKACYRQLIQI